MAELILQNARVYVDGYNLSGDLNAVTLNETVDLKDKTVLGCSGRKYKAGLQASEIRIGGFWNSSDASSEKSDAVIYKDLGSTEAVLTIVPNGTAIGTTANNKAYMLKGLAGEYSPSGTVGEMLSFAAAYAGNRSMVRGYLMECSSVLSTGITATIKKLGFKKPGKSVYCAVHAISPSTADATIKLHIEQSSSTDFVTVKSTLFTVTVSSSRNSHFGQWASTAAGSTTRHSFRTIITSSGSTLASIKGLVCLGLQK